MFEHKNLRPIDVENPASNPPGQSGITIRRALDPVELGAIYRFRYAIYVEEMSRKQTYADHQTKCVIDPLDDDNAHVFGAWDGKELVGTLRTNFLRSSSVGEYLNCYSLAGLHLELLDGASITTRLMIHPRQRGRTLAMRLACHGYQNVLRHGIKTDFLDCNDHLVSYFSRLGYVPHRTALQHPEYGQVTVMRLNVTDAAHLEEIRSPFSRILIRHGNLSINPSPALERTNNEHDYHSYHESTTTGLD